MGNLRVTSGSTALPEISRFLGIVIGMFFNEHGLPHFHAGASTPVVPLQRIAPQTNP